MFNDIKTVKCSGDKNHALYFGAINVNTGFIKVQALIQKKQIASQTFSANLKMFNREFT